jgi:hypothetical protein
MRSNIFAWVMGLALIWAAEGDGAAQEEAGKNRADAEEAVEATPAADTVAEEKEKMSPADEVPSEELVEALRADLERGELMFVMGPGVRGEQVHWDEYVWPFEAARWGMYWVEVRYHGLRKAMGVQARFRSDKDRLAKGFLKGGGTPEEPRKERLGKIYLAGSGAQELLLMTPEDDPTFDFKLVSMHLVPAPEGEETVAQDAKTGEVTLWAKDATTYSEKMRYEPKEVKNCLGYWTEVEDGAEWTFEISQPGKFAVEVTQGCGKGQGGSRVAVSVGEWSNEFEVKDTGGFQNWETVDAGVVEIEEAGVRVLKIQPASKAAKAVLDVNRVVLRPVD